MIENTSDRDPMLHLLGAMSDGSSDYITGMEAAGQQQFVNSDRIPTKGPTDALVALGFVLGDVDPADPLFRSCTLPPGWRRAGTSHSMHSDIVDANGRPRVGVFYKAAFYDRRADFHVKSVGSYVMELLWSDDPDPDPIVDEWTTRDLLIDSLTETRDVELDQAKEQDSYYPDGATRSREKAAKADRLIAKLGVPREAADA